MTKLEAKFLERVKEISNDSKLSFERKKYMIMRLNKAIMKVVNK